MSSSSWTFRPSVLQRDDYASLTIEEITNHYVADNDRAQKEGIAVPPPAARCCTSRDCPIQEATASSSAPTDEKMPSTTSTTPGLNNAISSPGRVSPTPGCRSFSSSTTPVSAAMGGGKRPHCNIGHGNGNSRTSTSFAPLRTLQWNIQAFTGPRDERNPHITAGIIETIASAHADVIVLNEYHWKDQHHSQQQLEDEYLRPYGYHHYYCGSVFTPTLVASKLPVLRFEEIILSHERSAMCILVDAASTSSASVALSSSDGRSSSLPVWVIGTHLDAFDGPQRLLEMQRFLKHLQDHTSTFDPSTPVLLMGDFNQQRTVDYPHDEWQRITSSMDRRKVCHDDGVADLLLQTGFTCVFDVCNNNNSSSATANATTTNWTTLHPPSTHWSGTTIDYSYARGRVAVDGVYISPAGYSDHRMTVCDWSVLLNVVTTTTAAVEARVLEDKGNVAASTAATAADTTTSAKKLSLENTVVVSEGDVEVHHEWTSVGRYKQQLQQQYLLHPGGLANRHSTVTRISRENSVIFGGDDHESTSSATATHAMMMMDHAEHEL